MFYEHSIPDGWQIKKIGDFCQIRRGASPRPIHQFLSDNGIPWVKIADATEQRTRFIDKTNEYIIEKGRPNTVMVKPGDLIVSNSATPGIPKFMKIHAGIHDGWLLIEPSIETDKDFVYYLFINERNNLIGLANGTIFKNLKTDIVRNHQVTLPPKTEQEGISKILSVIDTKIELNQRMNCALEAVGAALFRRWFVDFEFPNQEGKPYKTTGGKMQYNKDLGKDVPAEWEVTTLEKVAEFTRGFSYSGAEKSSTNGDLVFMTLNSIYEGGGFKREFSYLTSDRLKERHLVREGDIIIANTEQTKSGTLLGFPALVEFPYDYPKQVGCFSHHITKVTPYQEEMKYYLYHYLRYNQLNAIKYHTGSVIWGLDVAGFIKNEKIIIPDKKVLNLFSKLLDTIFQKILLNNKQSTNLVTLRDSLLPKLMSGKIRVPINKELGDA